MPLTINGSPSHVLIVHVVVVLLPVAVLASLVLVLVPKTRRQCGLLTLLVAFIACVAIPFAFLSGSKLEGRLPRTDLIARHVRLAHELLPLAAVFGLALAVFYVVDTVRRRDSGLLNDFELRFLPSGPSRTSRGSGTSHTGLSTAYRISAGVLVVLAVVTGIQVYRVGDAGAKAAWSGRLAPNAGVVSGPRVGK
jgi:uncharacterized membrane protein